MIHSFGFISNSQEIKDVFKEKWIEEEMLSATGLADLKDDKGISDQVLRHLRRKSNGHQQIFIILKYNFMIMESFSKWK